MQGWGKGIIYLPGPIAEWWWCDCSDAGLWWAYRHQATSHTAVAGCAAILWTFCNYLPCLTAYGVVPKGLLTFRGSLHREVAKTTSGTLVYRFERQTARKFISSFEKHCVFDLEYRILFQEPSDSGILYFNVIFHGKLAEKDINRQLMTCKCCDNWNSRSFGDPVFHHPKWIQCGPLIPVTLSLSSHTIQSVNNNPWRHWKDPQTSQVNKCPDIFRKCLTGTKLRFAKISKESW